MNDKLTVGLLLDTTGSMAPWLSEARASAAAIGAAVARLSPGARVGVVAYGDHCDGDRMLQVLPPTADVRRLERFLARVRPTGGGDVPEALECALAVLTRWDFGAPGAPRAAVVLADAPAHEPCDCPDGNDWRRLARALGASGLRLYPCTCGDAELARAQFEELAALTGGRRLTLADAGAVADLVVAAAATAAGRLQDFVDDLARAGRLDDGRRAFLLELDPRACTTG